jgi:DNA-binding winged helix-turn-helix (wHTH) protein
MDAADLQEGFTLGEWLVEPRDSRISGPGGVRPLAPDHVTLLLHLAKRHGEAVDRHALRELIWPGMTGSERRLRDGIRALRQALNGSPQDQRYIASIGHSGYALVAHLEPLPRATVVAAGAGSGRRPEARGPPAFPDRRTQAA